MGYNNAGFCHDVSQILLLVLEELFIQRASAVSSYSLQSDQVELRLNFACIFFRNCPRGRNGEEALPRSDASASREPETSELFAPWKYCCPKLCFCGPGRSCTGRGWKLAELRLAGGFSVFLFLRLMRAWRCLGITRWLSLLETVLSL